MLFLHATRRRGVTLVFALSGPFAMSTSLAKLLS